MTTLANQLVQAWQQPQTRRWLLLALSVGTLLLMGFYTVTEPAHLAHSHALDGVDWLGYAVCHRITERSFIINGRQLPLCARCTGMYLGVMVVFAVVFVHGRLRWTELPPWQLLLLLLGFIGVMGIDGINSYSHFFPDAPHLYTPRNWLRLLTGVGTGLAMGSFILPALAQTLWRVPVRRAPLGTFSQLVELLLVAAVTILLVLSNQPLLLYVLAFVSTAGLLLILGAINTILGLTLLRRDGRATRWRETAVPLLIGVLLAIIELSAISYLRFSLTGTMTGFPGL
ncbi:MAG: DUF2085 domain-containing protein [Anaerolineales bacterium]|nr:DUF2085 domain-containing protein [Anaerolineales bacterium]